MDAVCSLSHRPQSAGSEICPIFLRILAKRMAKRMGEGDRTEWGRLLASPTLPMALYGEQGEGSYHGALEPPPQHCGETPSPGVVGAPNPARGAHVAASCLESLPWRRVRSTDFYNY